MRLEFIEAGEIVNVHGLRGEVKVLCWLDDPEMLCEFDRCRIQGREYEMEQVRVQKTCNLVKLRTISADGWEVVLRRQARIALRLRNCFVQCSMGTSCSVVIANHSYLQIEYSMDENHCQEK